MTQFGGFKIAGNLIVSTTKIVATSPERSTTTLGCNIDRTERNIESTEPKIAKIFKRPKNREDGSDFDDFLMKSIATTQTFFSKIFASPKILEKKSSGRRDRFRQNFFEIGAILTIFRPFEDYARSGRSSRSM